MTSPAQLRVILEEHDVRKLNLPSGIPNTMNDLLSIVKESFQLQGDFSLMYLDKDFGDQFFTLTTTEEVKDKDTVKIVQVQPTITLNLTPLEEIDSPSRPLNRCSTDDCSTPGPWDQCSTDGSTSSSRDTVLLSSPECRSEAWPAQFEMPSFSYDVEVLLQAGNAAYQSDGKLLINSSVKSDILERLADAIFRYTAYPNGLQILAVIEALINKYPCLKEPGSFSGMYGWQQSLKYKMANYRTKLRSREVNCPELQVNSLKRKRPCETAPAKNIKRPKKAEVNYLPPHPLGETEESLEKERLDLLGEIKKKNNDKVIGGKMAKTFSCRRFEVVNLSPPIHDLMARWPALFSEAQVSKVVMYIFPMVMQLWVYYNHRFR